MLHPFNCPIYLIILLTITTHATIFYVEENATGNCTDPAHPCPRINQAINLAQEGDEIHISAGTYTEDVINVTKMLTFIGENLSVIRPVGGNHPMIIMADGTLVRGLRFEGYERGMCGM